MKKNKKNNKKVVRKSDAYKTAEAVVMESERCRYWDSMSRGNTLRWWR